MDGTTNTDQRHIDELLAELRVAGRRPNHNLLDEIRALGMEAVPALIAMVTDPTEYKIAEGDEEDRTGYAPYSAMQILGELHPPEALDPLLSLITWDDYDYISEDLPDVLAKFGRPVLDPVTAVLSDQEKTVWTRWRAVRTMRALADLYPEMRDEIVASFTAQLDTDEPDNEDLDILLGALVSELVHLNAEESIPSIIRAFEAYYIDPFVISWEDVREALDIPPEVAPHLDETAPTRRPFFQLPRELPAMQASGPPIPERLERAVRGTSEPYRRETPKVGRNDPCPCGSGKKYKKCHGR